MNRIIFSLLLIVWSFTITAKTVRPERAEKVATAFYMTHRPLVDGHITEVKFSHSSSFINNAGVPLYYVFNAAKNRGFVVVAADDRVRPVIAYSFEGQFIIDNRNQALQWLMKKYRQAIDRAIRENIMPDAAIRAEWENIIAGKTGSKANVSPLLTTQWDQDCYYNLYLPNDMSGPCNHVYTGCVATAMAQVMKYHNFPATGYGSHSYTHPTYGTLSANFGSTTYNWSQMPAQLTSSSSLTQKQAVARLMQHCGIATDMNYSANGSGTSTSFADDALSDYFRYNYSAYEIDASQYTAAEWSAILRDQLDRSLPMIYSGTDYSIGYGHAWVCDGHQGTSYFHMNWGWSGSGNGYFQLNNLTAGGSNFTDDQQAIINITPSGSSCNGLITYQSKRGQLEDGSGPANYISNQNCSWLIHPASASTLVLMFDDFDTEAGQDVVKVYDGTSSSGTLLGTFSGNNLPSMLISNSGAFYITFTTNGTTNKGGWKASWSDQMPVFCSNLKLMTAVSATVEDGSDHHNYLNNTQCKWLLRPSGASYVALSFQEFDLHPTDHLYIYNGPNTGSPLLGSYTGNTLPPVLNSTGNSMLLYFVTGPSGTAKGWKATYYKNDMSLDENMLKNGLTIFPNPACNILNIKSMIPLQKNAYLTISDAGGRLLKEIRIEQQGTQTLKIDISHLNAGYYFLRIESNKSVAVLSFVKQ